LYASVPNCTTGLQWCEVLYLLQHIRRGIKQHPIDAITADANRGLGALGGFNRALA
jgi:hypothetical protein